MQVPGQSREMDRVWDGGRPKGQSKVNRSADRYSNRNRIREE